MIMLNFVISRRNLGFDGFSAMRLEMSLRIGESDANVIE